MTSVAPHARAGEFKVGFELLSVARYEKRYRDQQLKYLERKAAKFGLQLAPT